ncbi:MAG TPA: efflux RND transporter periplasmic adaptor subunit [Steroidobacteraceae bacterium]|nr:efflux RND transporter periplasmic adaptor subunit [Steroidobacteraceae bacterium]
MDQQVEVSKPMSPATVRHLRRAGMIVGAIALVIVVTSVVSSHFATAKLQEAADQAAVITVGTTRPQPLAADGELILPGNVVANYEAPIYARTSGYLKRWVADIGTRVKAGQLLAEIDAPDLDQQLRQAEADLATAQANEKIAQITSDRYKDLRTTDSVSKQDADEKLSLAAAGDAQLQSARANAQRLRELIGFKRIVAPFDGVVTARNTDIGQLINAGSGTGPELFRVADTRRLRLYVRVPQGFAPLMKPGVHAQVSFADHPEGAVGATLERTADALDEASRTLLTQLIIENADGRYLPGAYVEVRFVLPPDAAAVSLKLPANVLLFRGDGLHVATVDAKSHVAMKAVTLGRDYGSDIEITSGLSASDAVILSPPDSLIDGAPVRIAQAKQK